MVGDEAGWAISPSSAGCQYINRRMAVSGAARPWHSARQVGGTVSVALSLSLTLFPSRGGRQSRGGQATGHAVETSTIRCCCCCLPCRQLCRITSHPRTMGVFRRIYYTRRSDHNNTALGKVSQLVAAVLLTVTTVRTHSRQYTQPVVGAAQSLGAPTQSLVTATRSHLLQHTVISPVLATQLQGKTSSCLLLQLFSNGYYTQIRVVV